MPQEAVEFWSNVFAKVAESKQWKEGYLNKFLLAGHYIPASEAKAYMQEFEDKYTAAK